MAFTNGPKYPCIQEGLVLLFDPKNPESYYKGTDKLYSVINQSVSGSEGQHEAIDWSQARSDQGYIELDGTDDFLYVGGPGGDVQGEFDDQSFTVQAWFNPDATGTQAIVANWHYTAGKRSWQMKIASATSINLALSPDGGYHGSNGTDYVDSTYTVNSMSTGTWYLLTLYHDQGVGVGATVDTQAYQTTSWTHGVFKHPGMQIGASNAPSNAAQEFDGKIGPVMLYNRALSQEEVNRNYYQLKGRFGL